MTGIRQTNRIYRITCFNPALQLSLESTVDNLESAKLHFDNIKSLFSDKAGWFIVMTEEITSKKIIKG